MGSRKNFDHPRQLKYLHRKWGEYIAHSKGYLRQETDNSDWHITVKDFSKGVVVLPADTLTALEFMPKSGIEVTFEVYRCDGVYTARNVAVRVQDRKPVE